VFIRGHLHPPANLLGPSAANFPAMLSSQFPHHPEPFVPCFTHHRPMMGLPLSGCAAPAYFVPPRRICPVSYSARSPLHSLSKSDFTPCQDCRVRENISLPEGFPAQTLTSVNLVILSRSYFPLLRLLKLFAVSAVNPPPFPWLAESPHSKNTVLSCRFFPFFTLCRGVVVQRRHAPTTLPLVLALVCLLGAHRLSFVTSL